MNKRLIKLPEVVAMTTLAKSTIYLKVSKAEFPKPISLGFRCVAWLEEEVLEWIEKRIEMSRNKK